MQVSVNIDDALVFGVTYARDKYNSALSVKEGENLVDHPDYIASDAAYVSYVVSKAVESYARSAVFDGVKDSAQRAVDSGLNPAELDSAVDSALAVKQV